MADDDQIPVPDPTVRTEERLRREISSVEKSFAKDVECIKEVQEEKFDAVEDKFGFVDRRFADLEARTDEQKRDTKAAVDAALQAAKAAVGQQTEASERSIAKSEAATTKQIDSVTARLEQSNAAARVEVDDLKSRMDRMESSKLGGSDAITSSRESQANVRAYVLAAAVILSTIIAVIGFVATNKP